MMVEHDLEIAEQEDMLTKAGHLVSHHGASLR
jgi:hypothetical protein